MTKLTEVNLPGIGPARARRLQDLGVHTVADLLAFAPEGAIPGLPAAVLRRAQESARASAPEAPVGSAARGGEAAAEDPTPTVSVGAEAPVSAVAPALETSAEAQAGRGAVVGDAAEPPAPAAVDAALPSEGVAVADAGSAPIGVHKQSKGSSAASPKGMPEREEPSEAESKKADSGKAKPQRAKDKKAKAKKSDPGSAKAKKTKAKKSDPGSAKAEKAKAEKAKATKAKATKAKATKAKATQAKAEKAKAEKSRLGDANHATTEHGEKGKSRGRGKGGEGAAAARSSAAQERAAFVMAQVAAITEALPEARRRVGKSAEKAVRRDARRQLDSLVEPLSALQKRASERGLGKRRARASAKQLRRLQDSLAQLEDAGRKRVGRVAARLAKVAREARERLK